MSTTITKPKIFMEGIPNQLNAPGTDERGLGKLIDAVETFMNWDVHADTEAEMVGFSEV
jgi:hypothetical protein